MKSQPNRNYKSNDIVMTPITLAKQLVNHLKPAGIILEPCKGTGNFIEAFKEHDLETDWCEITKGKNFFNYDKKVNWIITNPPWSQIRTFLNKSMEISDNVCFLMTINHLWTKARLRDIKEKGFGIKEIIIFDTPTNFPQLGFQVGMVYLKKGHLENIKFVDMRI